MHNYLNRICPVCGDNIQLTSLRCERCHYMLPVTTIVDGFPITAYGKPELSPFTLHIKDCKTIKFDVNGIVITADLGDVDFSKYEAIEINGYRFENTAMKKKEDYPSQYLNCSTYASSNGSECICEPEHTNDVEVSP